MRSFSILKALILTRTLKKWAMKLLFKVFEIDSVNEINTMLCPIKVNGNTIEPTVHTSCYCVLDLLCVNNLW